MIRSLLDWWKVRRTKISRIRMTENRRVTREKNREIKRLKRLHEYEMARKDKEHIKRLKIIADEEQSLMDERRRLLDLREEMITVITECQAAKAKMEQYSLFQKQMGGVAASAADQINTSTKAGKKALKENLLLSDASAK
jgi:hypothetical protein